MIYLDNNATTKVLDEVKLSMLKYLEEEFGNPSSQYYQIALNANRALENSRNIISKLFDCDSDEVIFTSGSTESNNMILKGLLDYNPTGHIIVSEVEHPSIITTAKYLESKGFEVTYLKVNKQGIVSKEDLLAAIKDNTFLISIMWVNNELGSINDIKSIADSIKYKNIHFHVDATQAVGKINVNIPEGVSSVCFSGHKIYGPKGIGAIILKKDSDGVPLIITPLLHGGDQEFGYRSGTQSVHNIVGLGKACEIVMRDFEKNINELEIKEAFLKSLLENKLGSKFILNSPISNKVPGVINFRINGIKNVIFLKKISKHIAASSGSACSIKHPSYTLKAIGLSENEIESSIRFSISPYDDISELEYIL